MSKHEGGIQGDRAFNGGMGRWGDKNISAKRDLLISADGMWDSFKNDDGMRDEKQNIACYRRYAMNCDSTEPGGIEKINILTAVRWRN